MKKITAIVLLRIHLGNEVRRVSLDFGFDNEEDNNLDLFRRRIATEFKGEIEDVEILNVFKFEKWCAGDKWKTHFLEYNLRPFFSSGINTDIYLRDILLDICTTFYCKGEVAGHNEAVMEG